MRPPGSGSLPGGRGQGGPGLGVFAGGVRAFLLWGDQPAAAEDGRKGAASLTWVRGAQVGAPATR